MKGLIKVIKIIQFALIVAFILIVVVAQIEIVKLSYDFAYTSLAWILILFGVTLLVRGVLSITKKVSDTEEEIIVVDQGNKGNAMSADPNETIGESGDEGSDHYTKPTEDAPIFSSAYGSEITGEVIDESDIDSMEKLVEKLTETALISGIKAKQSVFSSLLSAMSASHIVLIKGLENMILDSLISTLNTVFGSSSAAALSTKAELSVPENSLSYEMLRELDSENCIRVERIYGSDWDSFFGAYKDIISNMPTVYSFMDDSSKNVRGTDKTILNNIFLFCAVSDSMDIYQMPKEISRAVAFVEFSQNDVMLQKADEIKPEKYLDRKVISGNLFSDLVQTARSQYSISLSSWKKIDKLQALLEKPDRPLFGNIEIRQIERFVSVCMELGASEGEALDRVFCAKILPMVSHEIMDTIGSEIVISDSMESIFGSDVLPVTKNEIIKIQTSYISTQAI